MGGIKYWRAQRVVVSRRGWAYRLERADGGDDDEAGEEHQVGRSGGRHRERRDGGRRGGRVVTRARHAEGPHDAFAQASLQRQQ